MYNAHSIWLTHKYELWNTSDDSTILYLSSDTVENVIENSSRQNPKMGAKIENCSESWI